MSDTVQSIDTQEAVEALMSPDGPPAIIDFWADWCGPCKVMAPQYAAVAAALQTKAQWLLDQSQRRSLWARLFG